MNRRLTMQHGAFLRVIPALVAFAFPACNVLTGTDTSASIQHGDGTVFLALAEPPNAHMEALFQGVVFRDQAGCLRLQNSERSTVVWPHGATLDDAGSELRVRDVSGRMIGRIGGTFKFGGGHVPSLHDGIKLSQAQRDQARASCPGDYWIVGDTD